MSRPRGGLPGCDARHRARTPPALDWQALRKVVAVSVVLLALAPLPHLLPFMATLPEGLPSTQGWEKLSGAADLDDPRLRLEYEFYVNPRRRGVYELVRYRVTLPLGTAHADDYPALEKVQWHESEKNLRRFECGPGADSLAPCLWRELAPGSAEYHREVPVILWLYGVHRRLAAGGTADQR